MDKCRTIREKKNIYSFDYIWSTDNDNWCYESNCWNMEFGTKKKTYHVREADWCFRPRIRSVFSSKGFLQLIATLQIYSFLVPIKTYEDKNTIKFILQKISLFIQERYFCINCVFWPNTCGDRLVIHIKEARQHIVVVVENNPSRFSIPWISDFRVKVTKLLNILLSY